MKKIIDLHQDMMLYVSRPDLYKDTYRQTSFEQIKKNNIKIVIASAFVIPKNEDYLNTSVNRLIEKSLRAYIDYCRKHKEFIIIKNKKDVKKVLLKDGLYGLILHIEGLNVFNGNKDWKMLERFYNIGLRSIGPLWNINNPFGGGTLDRTQGLTNLGKKLIGWCERKNVLFDFAHMNEKTFWDTAQITKKPIFVSHGNSKSLVDTPRNYSDEQLKYIGRTKGVIGIFFSKKFLSNKKKVTVETVNKHIEHITRIAGKNSIAIGSDFGGIISGFPEELCSIDDLPEFLGKLPKKLQEKISWKNALRVINAHLS